MGEAAPFDEVAEGFDRLYGDNACKAEDAEMLRRFLLPTMRSLRADARVLDVGCGTGWLLDQPSAYALTGEYLGTDVSAKMVEIARAKSAWRGVTPIEFEVGDMQEPWAVEPAHYDLVMSLWCSASYAGPYHFAQQAHAALDSGGRVFAMPHALGAANPDGEHGVRGDSYMPPECYDPEVTGWRPWRTVEAYSAFMAAGFTDIRVQAWRSIHELPAWMPKFMHLATLHLESLEGPETERVFLIVTARRP